MDGSSASWLRTCCFLGNDSIKYSHDRQKPANPAAPILHDYRKHSFSSTKIKAGASILPCPYPSMPQEDEDILFPPQPEKRLMAPRRKRRKTSRKKTKMIKANKGANQWQKYITSSGTKTDGKGTMKDILAAKAPIWPKWHAGIPVPPVYHSQLKFMPISWNTHEISVPLKHLFPPPLNN